MKHIEDYRDDFGLLTVGPGRDGGDSCANQCTYAVAQNHEAELQLFIEKTSGKMVRHPDPRQWYSRTNTFSRDQLIPYLVALSLFSKKTCSQLLKVLLWHGIRLFLFTSNTRRNWQFKDEAEHNQARLDGRIGRGVKWDYSWKLPDITGPEVWALWIRALRLWPVYPLLLIFDLETLVSSLYKRFFSSGNDHRNHILVLEHGRSVFPTPVMELARWVYKEEIARSAVRDHFKNSDYPPMDYYLEKVIDRWI